MSFQVVKQVFLVLTLCAFSLSAEANKASSPEALTISSVETRRIDAYRPEEFDPEEKNDGIAKSGGEVGEVVAVIREMVALGKEIWPIIEKNKPVVNTSLNGLSALPRFDAGVDVEYPALFDMTNWWTPGYATYETSFKNLYGFTVVKFRYTVHYQPGGSYNGRGQYLTNVGITADELYVAWGYNVEAKSSLVGLTNKGASKGSPVAAMVLQLEYTVKTVLNESRNTARFYVAGDGTFKSL